MALTLNNFTGFETRGAEELSQNSFISYPTTGGRSGGSFGSDATAARIDCFNSGVADAGGKYIVGFGLKFDAAPSFDQETMGFDESGTGPFATLVITTSRTLLLKDDVNATIATGSTVLSVDTWYFIEIVFEHSTSGTIELFLDNNSEITEQTAQDLDGGSTFDSFVFLDGSGMKIGVDDFYILSGATSASDRFGDWAVSKAYQNTAEDATDQGDTLVDVGTGGTGTWANLSQTPGVETDDNAAKYEDTGNLAGSTICDEGTRAGPSGDGDITGTIKGAKWVGKFKRSTGGARTHLFSVGNDADWITTPTTKTDVTLSLTTAYEITEKLLEASDLSVPTTSDFFQHGFSKDATAGQDIFCAEIWAMLGYVPASGGGDITMVAAQGSYSLSGQAATTTKNTPVVASQGSYALTGKDAITSRTKSILAAQGAYALTGKDANTLWGHLFAAVQGSYDLTGQAAIISRQIAIIAAQGAYALTGKDAITSRTKSIPADQGSYALTGKDAATRVGQTLIAVQGAYALTGKAANLLFDHLIAAVQGSYALNGQAAVTTKDSPMVAAQGAYVLNGQAAILLRNHLIAAVQGSYALTGQPALTFTNPVMAADQGSYALNGQPANLLENRLIAAAQGSYAINGQDAILLKDVLLAAAQGFYALTGQTANLLWAHKALAEQGSYTLTGQPAVLIFSGTGADVRIMLPLLGVG